VLATHSETLHNLSFGPELQLLVPTTTQFTHGAFNAGLPQLPLTLLNSVVALSALAKDLYPNQREVGFSSV
jgi:hypothetical protein